MGTHWHEQFNWYAFVYSYLKSIYRHNVTPCFLHCCLYKIRTFVDFQTAFIQENMETLKFTVATEKQSILSKSCVWVWDAIPLISCESSNVQFFSLLHNYTLIYQFPAYHDFHEMLGLPGFCSASHILVAIIL